MAFEDGLVHICTIKHTWITKDSYWVQSKNNSTLYEGIKCRKWKGRSKVISNDKKQEHFVIMYKLYVLSEYDGAVKGDTVEINWETFIIYGREPIIDGSENYVIYNITTNEQP